jgi:hypothetical protein
MAFSSRKQKCDVAFLSLTVVWSDIPNQLLALLVRAPRNAEWHSAWTRRNLVQLQLIITGGTCTIKYFQYLLGMSKQGFLLSSSNPWHNWNIPTSYTRSKISQGRYASWYALRNSRSGRQARAISFSRRSHERTQIGSAKLWRSRNIIVVRKNFEVYFQTSEKISNTRISPALFSISPPNANLSLPAILMRPRRSKLVNG